MLAKLMSYLLVACAVVILVEGGVIWYLRSENKTLTENNATLTQNVKAAEAAVLEQKQEVIKALQARVEDQRELGKLGAEKAEAQRALSEKTAEYNSYRSRLETVALAKPQLLQRKANTAFKNLTGRFESLTIATPLTVEVSPNANAQ